MCYFLQVVDAVEQLNESTCYFLQVVDAVEQVNESTCYFLQVVAAVEQVNESTCYFLQVVAAVEQLNESTCYFLQVVDAVEQVKDLKISSHPESHFHGHLHDQHTQEDSTNGQMVDCEFQLSLCSYVNSIQLW